MSRQTTPFGLRMPDELREAVAAKARQEDRSMNSLIVRILRGAVESSNSASAPTA